MSKVDQYLEIVPLWVLFVAVVLSVAGFLLVPARLRLPASLAFLMLWLVTSEMQDLGFIAYAAKATGFAAYLAVAVAAFIDPGPKRPLPPAAWAYPPVALLGFLYIWNVSDLPIALAIRVQWLILVLAAMAVARTIVDRESLVRILRGITVGLGLAMAIPLSNLVLHPDAAFKFGMRFSPYGMNANHVGITFALATPLMLYFAMTTPRKFLRFFLIGVAGLSALMGLMTASRSTMVVMLGSCMPLAWVVTRQPVLMAAGALILAVGAYWMMGIAENINFERFGSLETGRTELAVEYADVIMERPLFGLLEVRGEEVNYNNDADIGGHAHNAYLETLYQGGLSYALPVFLIIAYTCWCTFEVWRRRTLIAADPLLVNMLIAMMVMTYAHGCVNHSLIWPTTTLAFPHVLLSLMFMCLAMDVAAGSQSSGMLIDEDYDDEDDEDWEYDEGELAAAVEAGYSFPDGR